MHQNTKLTVYLPNYSGTSGSAFLYHVSSVFADWLFYCLEENIQNGFYFVFICLSLSLFSEGLSLKFV